MPPHHSTASRLLFDLFYLPIYLSIYLGTYLPNYLPTGDVLRSGVTLRVTSMLLAPRTTHPQGLLRPILETVVCRVSWHSC